MDLRRLIPKSGMNRRENMRRILLFLFSHRTLALLRWDLYFVRLRVLDAIFNKRRVIRNWLRDHPGKKQLNLGSGPRGVEGQGWFNIDGFQDRNVHYLCDFTRRLPFEASTFDLIFTEHVLEHFDFENGQKLLSECNRILKPGGVLRVIVPDGEKILKSYFENPMHIIQYKGCKSNLAMEAVNVWFYQRYEHQTIYDTDYLLFSLLKSDFSSAIKTGFRQSDFIAKELLLDDPKYQWESLYMDAFKQ